MRGQIKFKENGEIQYLINGEQVTKEVFDEAIPSKKINYAKGECPATFPDFGDWSQENGGRGRYCPQKATKARDPKAFSKSRNDLIDWAHRQGKTVEK
jgi:hypothetical protein